MDIQTMTDELEQLNKNSFIGTCTLESAKAVTGIASSNSRERLFNVVKDLFAFSKKALTLVKSSDENTTGQDNQNLEEILRKVMPGLLKETLSSLSPVQTHPEPAQEEKPLPDMHTLTIQNLKPEGEEEVKPISEEEWVKVVKKDLKGSLKAIPVQKASLSSGTATLRFLSKDDLTKAEQVLTNKYNVTPKSEEQKKLDPKLTISNLDHEITTMDQLRKELLEENKYIKELVDASEQMRIVFLDEKKHFAVLQVSTEIRGAIKRNNDRVYLGLQSHLVRDRIHAVQCYHCQEFGHTSKSTTYCKSKDSDATCCFCAGNHASNKCLSKENNKTNKMKCANCAKSNNNAERNAATTHKASDSLCPFYVRETEKMMARTKGCTEQTKNLYRQRVQDLRAKLGRR